MANSAARRRVAILGAGMTGELHRRTAAQAGADAVGDVTTADAAGCDAPLRSADTRSRVGG